MFSNSWSYLTNTDFNFLEFISLGNNFFLLWIILIWSYYFFIDIKSFYSYSTVSLFKFYNLIYIKDESFIFLFRNLLFYEYFSIIFPFFGIFLSLTLNFSILSISGSEVLGINSFMFIVGKQWGWDFFYLFSGLNFFSLSLNLIQEYSYYNTSKVLDFSLIAVGVEDYSFNTLLNSNFISEDFEIRVEESPLGNEFSSIRKDLLEGVPVSIYILNNSINIFYVTSLDVIHSFGCPSLGLKIDAIPGSFSGELLECTGISDLESFEFGCYEFCGINHSTMFGDIFVLNIKYFFYFI